MITNQEATVEKNAKILSAIWQISIEEASEILKITIDTFKLDDSDRSDINCYMFPQGCGSTALGYSSIGGQAMTSSHTIIFHNTYTGSVMLSYGGRFIKLKNPNQKFFEDMANQRIEPEYKFGKYRRKE